MVHRNPELEFNVIIAVSVGIGLVSHLLALFLRPMLSVAFGVVLIVVGARFVVPRDEQVTASFVGILTFLVAGVAVPRAVVSSTWPLDELAATVALAGVVLLLTFAILRVTAFDRTTPNGA